MPFGPCKRLFTQDASCVTLQETHDGFTPGAFPRMKAHIEITRYAPRMSLGPHLMRQVSIDNPLTMQELDTISAAHLQVLPLTFTVCVHKQAQTVSVINHDNMMSFPKQT